MRRQIYHMILFSLLFFPPILFAQGISRSSGLGFRFGTWSKNAGELNFMSSNSRSLDVAGSGFFYYFTRYKDDWFWEFSIGGVGSLYIEDTAYSQVEETSIVPITFGLRNDFLSRRIPGKLQPYYTFGAGPYMVNTDVTGNNSNSEEVGYRLGIYGGGGINMAFASWFALNVDLKYHLLQLNIFNPASGFNLNFGFSLMWGKKREIYRVRETRLIVSDIYPLYYQFYNTYPLALVTVQNTFGAPIEVNVRASVRNFSVRAKESGFITINKGETRDIPATVVFDPKITGIASREPAVLDIEVEGRAGTTQMKEISTPLTIHTRNSWNGEVDKLIFFTTPDDPDILELSRSAAQSRPDTLSPAMAKLRDAHRIFDRMGELGIRYQSDPNVPFYKDDRVQFASETLQIGSGDCDDLVVLYASLLESLGIHTAFVQVKDPDKPLAHLYILFNTQATPEEAYQISTNEKRYILRVNRSGNPEVWIPVETTLINHGFEEAWNQAALNYLKDADLRGGLSKGWVQLFDVQ